MHSRSDNGEQFVKGSPISKAMADVRRGFVRKVYSILSFQLLLTVAIATPFYLYCDATWIKHNMGIYYAALSLTLVLIFGMSCCCQQCARQYPTNYLMLFGFTAAESVTIGFVITLYTVNSVLLAVATTAFVFFGLTLYACFTKTDFTGCGPYMVGLGLCLLGFSLMIGIWSMFAPVPPALHLLYSCVGALLFSMYIVYDTQLIVGGEHKAHEFTVDDYCFAALHLYLDVIGLFLNLLSMLGERK